MYDRLFADAHPDAGSKDFLQNLKTKSLQVMTSFKKSLPTQTQQDQKFQLERFGPLINGRFDQMTGRNRYLTR
jgi:glutaminyl-tRNA synthetase